MPVKYMVAPAACDGEDLFIANRSTRRNDEPNACVEQNFKAIREREEGI